MKKSILILSVLFAAAANATCKSDCTPAPAYGGAGGSVLGSGNSSNINTLGQQQGQAQGQMQAAISNASGGAGGSASSGSTSSSNSGGNTLNNGSSSNSNAASNSGGNTMVGGANVSSQGMTSSVTIGGDTYERNPVASAWAAPLTSANGTCMGSSSAGGQGVTFGLSIGTTWTDSSCDARYDAISLNSLGQSRAAIARLCQKKEIEDAMKAAGTPCPAKKDKPAAQALAETNVYTN